MKKTVGAVAADLLQKDQGNHTAHEQMQENLTDYERNVIECAERGLKAYNSDFFIVVLSKKEPLLPNVIRNYFFHRRSCPSPQYDQVAYHYIFDNDALKMLWCIPDKETCEMYRTYTKIVNPAERELLQFILDFFNGGLDRLARKLNKEPGETQYLEDKHVITEKN